MPRKAAEAKAAEETQDQEAKEVKDTKEAKESKKAKKAKGVEANAKALQFQEFLMDNEIRAFSTESIDDDYQTVIFRSRVEAKGQQLPLAIFIDMSVFTIIRVQVATGISESRLPRISAYLNDLNRHYKIFKYYLREGGTVYLDICLPFVDETFDCKMIQLILNILVKHLEENYEDFMEHVWAKEEKI